MRGASVLGVARSASGLEAIPSMGVDALGADATRQDGRAAIVHEAGHVDHLVLAHGETTGHPIDEVTEDDFPRLIGANLQSGVLSGAGLRAPAAGRRVHRHGRVHAAKTGNIPEVAVYAAAKAGVLSLTRNFASAHSARGMRVNGVCPGIIDTPMQRRFLELNAPLQGMTPEALNAKRLQATPMRRAGTPNECAEVICFLLSDRAIRSRGGFAGSLPGARRRRGAQFSQRRPVL